MRRIGDPLGQVVASEAPHPAEDGADARASEYCLRGVTETQRPTKQRFGGSEVRCDVGCPLLRGRRPAKTPETLDQFTSIDTDGARGGAEAIGRTGIESGVGEISLQSLIEVFVSRWLSLDRGLSTSLPRSGGVATLGMTPLKDSSLSFLRRVICID